jgi:hypothetical protein
MPTVSVVPDGVLAYGMQLPVQALSVRVSMPWEQEGTVDDMVRVAQAADAAGFLYVAVCHHVAIPPYGGHGLTAEAHSGPRQHGLLGLDIGRQRRPRTHLVAGDARLLARHDRHDAGGRHRGGRVDPNQARVGVDAAHEGHVELPRMLHVAHVPAASAQEPPVLLPANRRPEEAHRPRPARRYGIA